jgi:hypothetical protein
MNQPRVVDRLRSRGALRTATSANRRVNFRCQVAARCRGADIGLPGHRAPAVICAFGAGVASPAMSGASWVRH